jgi:hypothetical protein
MFNRQKMLEGIEEIDDAFVARVYRGPDPVRFKALLTRCLSDPNAFITSTGPHAVGVAVLHPDQPELGNVAVGHYVFGDWSILKTCMQWARDRRADAYVYPVNFDNPQYDKIRSVLMNREGFTPYQEVLIKRFHHDGSGSE